MPYSIDKKNKCVYKKKDDGSRGAKVGCTKGDLQNYVSALHANANEARQTLLEIRQALKESDTIVEAPVQLANNFQFFVVEKSKDPMDKPMDLLFETDPIGFANQIRGGLLPEEIHGVYLSEEEAINTAHDLVQAVYETAKGLEEKKVQVTEKINKKIAQLQKEINSRLKAAKSDPMNAENYETQAEALMSQIKELRAKNSLVEKSKKPLEEKDEDSAELPKTKKGLKESEDHEVSMALNSLKSIVSSATQLMNKLGQEEKDIPAWIQDHISNAENYIRQASQNYHEYNSEPEGIFEKRGKDYDKDGKVEPPAKEYKGVKDKAIKQAIQNKK
jgi:hypothetical protein